MREELGVSLALLCGPCETAVAKMTGPHRPPTRVGADPPEVKQYREDFEADQLGPPACQEAGCRVHRCGVYCQTDARQSDGLPLAPIPIQRWRCRLHGEVENLPPFLRAGGHYLAEVVDSVLDEYAKPEQPPSIDALTTADGPAGITLRRWVASLVSCDPEALGRRLRLEQLRVLETVSPWRWTWLALGSLAAKLRVFASSLIRWFRPEPAST